MKAYRISPIFRVSDLADAISFYTSKLGFTEEFIYGEPAYYAGVRKDNVLIHLNSADEQDAALGKGYIYIFCEGIDEYYQTLCNSGVEITSELETWPYGMRDFQIVDCSGNHISFGCAVELNPNGNHG